jgi:Arc/MetJ-type ribon-helix-helix transcriptional regulator
VDVQRPPGNHQVDCVAVAGGGIDGAVVAWYDWVIPYSCLEAPMAVRKVAVTLPEELFEMVERLRDIEHRSRSEVFQDALRRYFGEPVYEPTDEERRLLDEALAELEREPDAGRSWDEVRADIWPG